MIFHAHIGKRKRAAAMSVVRVGAPIAPRAELELARQYLPQYLYDNITNSV